MLYRQVTILLLALFPIVASAQNIEQRQRMRESRDTMRTIEGDVEKLQKAVNEAPNRARWLLEEGTEEHNDTKNSTQKVTNNNLARDLLEAARVGKTDVVQRLLAKGADVNSKDKNNDTPLLLAIRKGHQDIIQVLLAKGADINVKNKSGETALLLAIDSRQSSIVQLLLVKGADVKVKHKAGSTALQLLERDSALARDKASYAYRELRNQISGNIGGKIKEDCRVIKEQKEETISLQKESEARYKELNKWERTGHFSVTPYGEYQRLQSLAISLYDPIRILERAEGNCARVFSHYNEAIDSSQKEFEAIWYTKKDVESINKDVKNVIDNLEIKMEHVIRMREKGESIFDPSYLKDFVNVQERLQRLTEGGR